MAHTPGAPPPFSDEFPEPRAPLASEREDPAAAEPLPIDFSQIPAHSTSWVHASPFFFGVTHAPETQRASFAQTP